MFLSYQSMYTKEEQSVFGARVAGSQFSIPVLSAWITPLIPMQFRQDQIYIPNG